MSYNACDSVGWLSLLVFVLNRRALQSTPECGRSAGYDRAKKRRISEALSPLICWANQLLSVAISGHDPSQ
jgi:hypothetical protein